MFFVKPAYANCPVCIVTVGGGLILAKKLGIDDLLVSIWLSGLNTAIAFWMAKVIKRKIGNNPYLWTFGFYFLSIIYLWYSKQIGHPGNTFLTIDKVLFGLTIGLLVFLMAVLVDQFIRLKNNGKVLFYFQRIIIPVIFLVMATIIFKFLI